MFRHIATGELQRGARAGYLASPGCRPGSHPIRADPAAIQTTVQTIDGRAVPDALLSAGSPCIDSGALAANCALDSGAAETLTGMTWYYDGAHQSAFDESYSLHVGCVNHQTWTVSVNYVDSAGVSQYDSISRVCSSSLY